MKATVLARDLKEALAVAEKTVGNGKKIPVLAGVLLEATADGGLLVAGTDIDTRAWRTASAKVDQAGSVILPPKALGNFLDACSDGDEVSITVKNTRSHLVCGRDEVRLAGLGDPDEFPAASDFDEPAFDLTLAAGLLADLIGSVGHAVAPDESRPVLAGILVEIEDGSLTLTAADGFRLASRCVDLDDAGDISLIVRGAPFIKAAGMLKGATSARLLVDRRGTHLLVDCETGCISIALIEGQFVTWRRMVPTDSPMVVVLRRAALSRAMKLVRTITTTSTDDKNKVSHASKARLTITADSVEVRAGDENGDQEAELVLDAKLSKGESGLIGVNSQYLYDALEALDGDVVVLELNEGRPILVHAEGDRSNLHVLMPMNVARPS